MAAESDAFLSVFFEWKAGYTQGPAETAFPRDFFAIGQTLHDGQIASILTHSGVLKLPRSVAAAVIERLAALCPEALDFWTHDTVSNYLDGLEEDRNVLLFAAVGRRKLGIRKQLRTIPPDG